MLFTFPFYLNEKYLFGATSSQHLWDKYPTIFTANKIWNAKLEKTIENYKTENKTKQLHKPNEQISKWNTTWEEHLINLLSFLKHLTKLNVIAIN